MKSEMDEKQAVGCWRYLRRRMTSSRVVYLFILLLVFWLIIRHIAFDQRMVGKRNIQVEPSNDVINASTLEKLHKQQELRIKHLHQQCKGQQHQNMFGMYSEKWAYGRIEVNREHRYIYCPIFKVGSTFFNRIFYIMRRKKKNRNPYSVPIEIALSAKRKFLSELPTSKFLHSSTSIIFVREPFSRLLSGYVDKFFGPNLYFWEEIGKHIISKFRPTATAKEIQCGSDVTFEEFVRYVIDAEMTNSTHRDAHFSPAYDQCKPCNINYTIIGKMENFKTDVIFTLNQLGFFINEKQFSMWNSDDALDAILDSTQSAFYWENRIRECMTWTDALKRVWRKFQIRGILLVEDKFPWISQYSEKMLTIRIFSETVRMLHVNSDKDKLKRQKREMLSAAFSQIKFEYIERLNEIFKPDFDLFQYDSHPGFIYDEDYVKQFRLKNSIFDFRNI